MFKDYKNLCCKNGICVLQSICLPWAQTMKIKRTPTMQWEIEKTYYRNIGKMPE